MGGRGFSLSLVLDQRFFVSVYRRRSLPSVRDVKYWNLIWGRPFFLFFFIFWCSTNKSLILIGSLSSQLEGSQWIPQQMFLLWDLVWFWRSGGSTPGYVDHLQGRGCWSTLDHWGLDWSWFKYICFCFFRPTVGVGEGGGADPRGPAAPRVKPHVSLTQINTATKIYSGSSFVFVFCVHLVSALWDNIRWSSTLHKHFRGHHTSVNVWLVIPVLSQDGCLSCLGMSLRWVKSFYGLIVKWFD